MTTPATTDPTTQTPASPAPQTTVNPDTHDPVSGKPWKEIAKEEERKRKEAEGKVHQPKTDDEPPPTTRDREGTVSARDQFKQQWERKFVDDPFGAIEELVLIGSRHVVKRTREDIGKANRLLKEVKKDLKAKYEDFTDVEQSFDEHLEDVAVERMTKEGLEMVFHSLRGQKLEEKVKQLQAKVNGKQAVEEPRIVGPAAGSGSGTPVSPSGEKPLTKAQQAEFAKMGDVSETGYRRLLKERQERAKKLDCKVLPETISEPLQRPKK